MWMWYFWRVWTDLKGFLMSGRLEASWNWRPHRPRYCSSILTELSRDNFIALYFCKVLRGFYCFPLQLSQKMLSAHHAFHLENVKLTIFVNFVGVKLKSNKERWLHEARKMVSSALPWLFGKCQHIRANMLFVRVGYTLFENYSNAAFECLNYGIFAEFLSN